MAIDVTPASERQKQAPQDPIEKCILWVLENFQNPMSAASLRARVARMPGPWTFDEATCNFVPPIPRPEPDQTKLEARIFTFWSGADKNWKDSPPYPNDGNQYKFDFIIWNWIPTESKLS